MIDTVALRKKVIDLAIQGKLTQQLPEDGNAEDLYAQIQEERAKLIKEGKTKQEKPLPEISDDEIPFEIPSNWKWMRIADVVMNSLGGGTPSKNIPEYWNDGDIPWVSVKDFSSAESGYLCDTIDHITQDGLDNSASNLIDEDAIVICMRMALGKIVRLSRPMAINQDLRAIWLYECINESYFVYFYSVLKIVGRGTTVSGIRKEELMNFLIPLPPLSEQKRIVEKLNDVLAQIDIIDALQQQYEFDRESLKGKIIDAGIQGKLTEQLPEDGNAEELYMRIQEEKEKLIKKGKIRKEKALPNISDEEIPFEIPSNWKWVRISDVIDVRDGTHDSPKYHDEGIPLVTSKNISSGKLIFDDVKLISMDDAQKINERSYVDDGDILFAMIGSIGNPVIVHKDREFCIKNVALFKNFAPMHISMDYFYWFLMHEQFVLRKNAIGGLQPFVSLKVFRSHLLPLPPMSEQIRIAERLYELEDVVLEQEK